MFESGVKGYVKGKITVEVGFPISFSGDMYVSCNFCKFYSKNSGICLITKEISAFPDKYIGDHCPIEFEEL